MAVELAEIEQCLAREDEVPETVTFPPPDSPELHRAPERWRAIAEAADARARCREALSLWNTDLLELVPTFAATFTSELADVRLGRIADEWVLVYALEHFDADTRYVVCWIGWDPATFGDTTPPLWDSVPPPLQTFLLEVHAGFTAPNWMSFGPVQPHRMLTLAAMNGYPDGIPDWADTPDATRLLPLAATYSGLYCCVSPDLPADEAVLVYRGELDPPQDVGTLLDRILDTRFAVVDQEADE